MLLPPLEGWGRFTHEVGRRLLPLLADVPVYMLFDRPPRLGTSYSPHQQNLIIPPPARHWTLYEIWYRLSVPLALRFYRPKVFFGTYGIAPAPIARQVTTVIFIHDIAFERHPEFLSRGWFRYYKRTFRESVQKASLIFANSESVLRDLKEIYHAPASKIVLAHSGIDTTLFRPLPAQAREAIRQAVSGGLPYILYVGSIHPRKNFIRLLRAYDRLREMYRDPLRLVVVGRYLLKSRRIEVMRAYEALRHRNEVLWKGVVPDEDLIQLYNGAAVVAYPSLYEGFGSPVGEALACGTVVVTSQLSSLPEVGGEAAFYADPYSEEDIARALYQALTEPPEARATRIEKGLVQAQRFRWEDTVQKITEALRSYL